MGLGFARWAHLSEGRVVVRSVEAMVGLFA